MTDLPIALAPPVRVAVIGCGDIAAIHFAAIAAIEGVVLVAVCDTDPERLEAAVQATGAPGFATHAELFASIRPDAVHITTPHFEHARIAVDALDAGIHVILEKPLAHTVAAGAEVAAAAHRSRAKLAVCFQNRYNTPVQRMRELLDSGALGAVTGASATVVWSRPAAYYQARPWRGTWAGGGGGLLMNQAIHTLDLLIWLVGDLTSVSGGIATRVLGDTIEVEDTADLVLEHSGGVRSVLFATNGNAVNEPVTLSITTERATLRYADALTVVHRDGRTERVEQTLATGDRAYWGLSHETLIRDFYARLDDPARFWIGAAEAQKSLDAIQHVYRSSGRLPVGL